MKLEEIYDDLHCKENVIEKFRKLKICLGSFNTFHSEFIKLVAKLKFTKKIVLQKYMHKLSPLIQDRINSGLKYPDNIKDLVMHCQKIYDQILATDWLQSNTKPANIKVANIPTRFILSTRFVLPLSPTISSSPNSYCSKPRSVFL